jgi:cell division septation protein DedD
VTEGGPPVPPDPSPIPALLAGAALVALVPAGDDLERAASGAWDFARTAASAGRRIALVDCFVDAPVLHRIVGEQNGDGIVDVFEYGASLSHLARARPEPTLYFIPAGTLSTDPATMMASARWSRLAAGFRHEDAVLLLFVAPEHVGAVSADLDGIVAVAPDGVEAGMAATPEIQEVMDRGIRLLATVSDAGGIEAVEPPPASGTDRPASTTAASPITAESVALRRPEPAEPAPPEPWAAAAGEAEPGETERGATAPGDAAAPDAGAVSGDDAPPRRSARRPIWRPMHTAPATGHRLVYGFILLALVGAALIARVRFRPHASPTGPAAPAQPRPATVTPSHAPATATAPAVRAPAPAPAPAAAADSLPFAVQVSAWTRLSQALGEADRLEARHFAAIIAPIEIRRRLWYRVYAGPAPSRAAAESLLRVVRAGELAGRSAVVALVPLSFSLRRYASEREALAARRRLRTRGVPTFVLHEPRGWQLLAGAYATPGDAARLDQLLTTTRNAGPLGPRVGIRP